jgi:hypothetical protein
MTADDDLMRLADDGCPLPAADPAPAGPPDLAPDERVLWRSPPPPRVTEYDDLADEYLIAANPRALCGVVVYARFRGRWVANPWGVRPVAVLLLAELGAARQVAEGLAGRVAAQAALLAGRAERPPDAAAERERAARVAEAAVGDCPCVTCDGRRKLAREIAAAIRAGEVTP